MNTTPGEPKLKVKRITLNIVNDSYTHCRPFEPLLELGLVRERFGFEYMSPNTWMYSFKEKKPKGKVEISNKEKTLLLFWLSLRLVLCLYHLRFAYVSK